MAEIVRTRAIVRGIVQGVYFRASTQRMAASVGVAGWVRNLPDGDVEAVFEGSPEQVDRAVSWARVGPSRAHVTDVETFDEVPEGLQGFSVR